jgi:hypothetical protein
LWLERGHVLSKLKLSELALGDYYKCQLLCEEGMKRDEEPSNITLAVISSQVEPGQDVRDPKVRYRAAGDLDWLKMDPMKAIIQSARELNCHQDSMDLASDSFGGTHDTHDREVLFYEIEDSE